MAIRPELRNREQACRRASPHRLPVGHGGGARRRCRSFTLIELVIVIGIVTILSALIYPLYGRAIEKGRMSRCASNLRQLYAATMNHLASGSTGVLPQCASHEWQQGNPPRWTWIAGWISWRLATYNNMSGPTTDKTTYWRGTNGLACIQNGVLYPYLADANVYVCPTFRQRTICGYTDAVRSYVMNSRVSGVSVYTNDIPLSRWVLFADAGLYRRIPNGGTQYSHWGLLDDSSAEWLDDTYGLGGGYFNGSSDAALQGYVSAGRVVEHIGEYHSGKDRLGNAVFIDGHVLPLSYTNTEAGCSGTY